MLTVTIHQPSYLPYLGVIEKVLNSDIFVIYDTAIYSKGYYHNRNYIKFYDNKPMLTLSVEKDGWKKSFKDVILTNKKQLLKHWNLIEQCYKKTKYFDEYKNEFECIFKNYESYKYLTDITVPIIKLILKIFNYRGKILLASQINYNTSLKSTDALLDICKNIKADRYISGESGMNYVKKQEFEKNNIDIIYQKFTCKVYEQYKSKNFEPYLASIDYVFNHNNNLSIFTNSFVKT